MTEGSGVKGGNKGSRFAVLQKETEDIQGGKKGPILEVVFTRAQTVNGVQGVPMPRVRNNLGGKNPQKSVKGKNMNKAQKDPHGSSSSRAQPVQKGSKREDDKGKKPVNENVKPVKNLKHIARKHAAEKEMLAAMRIMEKQAGGIVLEKTIGTMQRNSSVWDVSEQDLALPDQKLSLTQLSSVPETVIEEIVEESVTTQEAEIESLAQMNPEVDMEIGVDMGLIPNANGLLKVSASNMSL